MDQQTEKRKRGRPRIYPVGATPAEKKAIREKLAADKAQQAEKVGLTA